MKRCYFVCLFLAASVASAAAQGVRLGFKAGASRATYIGHARGLLEAAYRTQVQALTGAFGGVSLNIPLTKSRFWSLQPELVMVPRGFRLAGDRHGRRLQLRERNAFVELPLLVRYTWQGFFLEAGPQLGYFVHNRTWVEDDRGERSYSAGLRSAYKGSLGVTAGLGYELASGPQVGIRYTLSATRSTASAVGHLYAGYTFGRKRSTKG